MKISATIVNSYQNNTVELRTNDSVQHLTVPHKTSGYGSAVNGGEFLFLALATCFCNDIYREAGKRNIKITHVAVEVSGEFSGEGEPGDNITYKVKIDGDATTETLAELVRHTDAVAEIHNTLRIGREVLLLD